VFFIASLLSAIFIFITARIFAIPQKLFLIMDAAWQIDIKINS
jgi:hypothetical protein